MMPANNSELPAKVTVGREVGYIFLSEEAGSYCFVPEVCVTFTPAGEVRVDYVGYYLSGWSLRNLRWSDDARTGSHAFPDPGKLVMDLSAPAIQHVLGRLRSSVG